MSQEEEMIRQGRIKLGELQLEHESLKSELESLKKLGNDHGLHKLVKLKSNKEINELIRQGLVELLGSSDSGEIVHYGVKDGGQTHVISCWYDDYGTEYLVVDHEQPISKTSYNNRKIMFEE